ncbi:6-phosphogluconate phosphatase [Nymphon striatum]|nr:6-phosphogluconate phosphatase [Nymphon striatum]
MSALIVFDFDGVIADSEYLANVLLAEIVTELGKSTTVEDCYKLYMGKRFEEITASIEKSVGHPDKLVAVEGAREYIDQFKALPQCIASSSSPDRLAVCLEVLQLAGHFLAQTVFSASNVERGKPHPDVFLHAA